MGINIGGGRLGQGLMSWEGSSPLLGLNIHCCPWHTKASVILVERPFSCKNSSRDEQTNRGFPGKLGWSRSRITSAELTSTGISWIPKWLGNVSPFIPCTVCSSVLCSWWQWNGRVTYWRPEVFARVKHFECNIGNETLTQLPLVMHATSRWTLWTLSPTTTDFCLGSLSCRFLWPSGHSLLDHLGDHHDHSPSGSTLSSWEWHASAAMSHRLKFLHRSWIPEVDDVTSAKSTYGDGDGATVALQACLSPKAQSSYSNVPLLWHAQHLKGVKQPPCFKMMSSECK